MRILFLSHSFNSLAQRLWAELEGDGHEVTLELDVNDALTREAVTLARPDVVIAPFLKRAIPPDVWSQVRCLVVHPGIEGDRGPSALDWAVQEGEREWGVTVLQANGEFDAGDVWASTTFPMREATKGSLYRNEVTEAALACVREALARIERGQRPRAQEPARSGARGRVRPLMKQADRAIDWALHDTSAVLRRIRAADGTPGVLDMVLGLPCRLYDARGGESMAGAAPGSVVARHAGAILRATRDGSVWIGHLAAVDAGGATSLKLPATQVLGERIAHLPVSDAGPTPIRYEEQGDVGLLHFAFHNGAMGVAECVALRAAIEAAGTRRTRVLVLCGGRDFWSNGLDLAAIEAAAQPAEASWRNIEAMNDVVLAILSLERHFTIAALQGNAGAGGCFAALAADRVLVRRGCVLNPHYRAMGNLYGSEYWTYLLPRRVGAQSAAAIAERRLPMTGGQAAASGLVDEAFGTTPEAFLAGVLERALTLAADPHLPTLLADKQRRRSADEMLRPLASYRETELARMRLNFFGFDPSYHVARHHFVRKLPKARTPSFLARHRAPVA